MMPKWHLLSKDPQEDELPWKVQDFLCSTAKNNMHIYSSVLKRDGENNTFKMR